MRANHFEPCRQLLHQQRAGRLRIEERDGRSRHGQIHDQPLFHGYSKGTLPACRKNVTPQARVRNRWLA